MNVRNETTKTIDVKKMNQELTNNVDKDWVKNNLPQIKAWLKDVAKDDKLSIRDILQNCKDQDEACEVLSKLSEKIGYPLDMNKFTNMASNYEIYLEQYLTKLSEFASKEQNILNGTSGEKVGLTEAETTKSETAQTTEQTKEVKKIGSYRELKSNSEKVKELQQFLNEYLGTNLETDGKYGKLTMAAVKEFQRQQKLLYKGVYDGKAGKNTLAKIEEVKNAGYEKKVAGSVKVEDLVAKENKNVVRKSKKNKYVDGENFERNTLRGILKNDYDERETVRENAEGPTKFAKKVAKIAATRKYDGYVNSKGKKVLQGMCLAGVKDTLGMSIGLKKGAGRRYFEGGAAKNFLDGVQLGRLGYKKLASYKGIKSNKEAPSTIQDGDIIVFDAPRGPIRSKNEDRTSGHIQIASGKSFYSDFEQNNFLAGVKYTNTPFTIFRHYDNKKSV